MGSSGWFESVAEAQRRARKRLPKSVYGALIAGSERGLSYDDNTAAYDRPRSDPAIRAPYTDLGSRFRARRWASATDSNQPELPMSRR